MLRKLQLWFKLDEEFWSELYYFDSAHDTPSDMLSAFVQARQIISASPTRLLSGVAEDIDRPVSRVEVVYDQELVYYQVRALPIKLKNTAQAQPPDVAYGMAFRTAAGARRVVWIGGLPMPAWQFTSVDNRDRYLTDVVLWDRMNSLRDFFLSAPWKLQIRERLAPPAVSSAKVVSIGTGAAGLYLIGTDQAHGFSPNDDVTITGGRGQNLTRMRGIRRVKAVPSPTTFLINRGPLPERGMIRYTGGATATEVAYGFSPAVWVPKVQYAYTTNPVPILTGTPRFWPYFIRSRLRGGNTSARRGRKRASEG